MPRLGGRPHFDAGAVGRAVDRPVRARDGRPSRSVGKAPSAVVVRWVLECAANAPSWLLLDVWLCTGRDWGGQERSKLFYDAGRDG
jgi:hypothetical protein